MTLTRRIALFATVVVAFGMGGCKTVQTTFVNTTSEPLDLQVNGPGLNVGYIGTVPAGGQIRTKIEVSPIWLPTTYTWTAGKHNGAFTLTSDVKDRIWVGIPMGAQTDDPAWRSAEGKAMTGGHTPVTYAP